MASETSSSPSLFQGLEPSTRWKHLSPNLELTKTLWQSNHPGAKAFRAVAFLGGLGVPFIEFALFEAFARSVVINPGITFANRVVRWIQPQGNDEDLFLPANETTHDIHSVSAGSNEADDERDSVQYAFVPVHSDSESITGSESSSQHAREKSAGEYKQKDITRELIERALEDAADLDGVARLEQSLHSQDAMRSSAEIFSDYERDFPTQEVIQPLENADQDPDGVAHLIQLNSSDSEHAAGESPEIISDYEQKTQEESQENMPHYIPPELQTGWIHKLWGSS